jgi:hypothetical protein
MQKQDSYLNVGETLVAQKTPRVGTCPPKEEAHPYAKNLLYRSKHISPLFLAVSYNI